MQNFLKKPYILIVDDHYEDIFLARESIIESGIYSTEKESKKYIYEAKDGEEALNILNNNNIDIMLLDLNMPKKNGLELLKDIKDSQIKVPTIIILTSSDMESDINESIKLGVDGYMIKPLEISDFEDRIKSIKYLFIDKHFEYMKYNKK